MSVLGEPRMHVELEQHHIQSKQRTSNILGYGEESLTLWALKHRLSDILREFQDQTAPSDCLIFYRPSFGRSGGKDRAEFGEFDAILVSSKDIYLIESKWDNLSRFKDGKITLRTEQKKRHHIFSWYLTHWNEKLFQNWRDFVKKHEDSFKKEFPKKRIAPPSSLLAANLEFILTTLQKHCKEIEIKSVLLFFYNRERSETPSKTSSGFDLVCIDYCQELEGNFIPLEKKGLRRPMW